MKSIDEIKKGLECCMVDECFGERENCPYTADPNLCVGVMCADVLALIRQLEAERDAAVKDVKRYAACCRCKNLAKYGGKCFGGLRCEVKGDAREFEWRGVQKEDGNA